MTKYEEGFLEGKQHGYALGFNTGFWSAILLISGVIVGGFIAMKAIGI